MERKRFRFVGSDGMPRGIEDTENLQSAIKTAIEFQCEVIDTMENDIVFSAWDGWNKDWEKRNERMEIK